jgi:hypothetical protein
VFRGIQRREYSADEAVLNGLEAVKSAAIGELSEPRRTAAMNLLHQTGADDPLARQVQRVLADVTNLPDPSPNRLELWGAAVRAWYLGLTGRRWFVLVITWWFVVVGSAQLVAAIAVVFDDNSVKGFVDWATVVSSAISGALIVVGVVRLRHHRLEAYRWFERGILVQIFVTQVFEFAHEQLTGVFSLVVNILIWVALRSMIRAENERQLVGFDEVASVESSG